MKTKWKDEEVEINASFIPQRFWIAASIDVLLNQKKILSTGGQLKFKGTCIERFDHAQMSHTVRLEWERFFLHSIPCSVYVDDEPVFQGSVAITNRPMNIVALILLGTFVFSLCLLIISILDIVLKIVSGN